MSVSSGRVEKLEMQQCTAYRRGVSYHRINFVRRSHAGIRRPSHKRNLVKIRQHVACVRLAEHGAGSGARLQSPGLSRGTVISEMTVHGHTRLHRTSVMHQSCSHPPRTVCWSVLPSSYISSMRHGRASRSCPLKQSGQVGKPVCFALIIDEQLIKVGDHQPPVSKAAQADCRIYPSAAESRCRITARGAEDAAVWLGQSHLKRAIG